VNGCWKCLWPEAVNDFQGFPNWQYEIKNPHVSTESSQRIPILEEADNWGIVSSAAELIEEEDLEQWTALCEQEEDSDMSRPQLTVNALKKAIQVADTSHSHFFEFDQFMDRCLKYKHEIEAVMTVYRLCRWHSNQGHPFLHKSSVCPSTMHSALCDHLHNFQLVTGMLFH